MSHFTQANQQADRQTNRPSMQLVRRIMMVGVVASSLTMFGVQTANAAPGGQNAGQNAAQNAASAFGAPNAAAKKGPTGPRQNPLISLLPGGADEEAAANHVSVFLGRFVPDASEAQKTSIQNLVKAAYTDLKPLCEQHKATQDKEVTLLTAATVDRTALESNRVERMRLADLIGKRKTQGLSDIVDVLTSVQRAKMAELMKADAPKQPPATNSALKSPFGK